MYVFLFLGFLTTSVVGFVREEAEDAVINGDIVDISDYPFYALLVYAETNTVLCGSSIISTKVLLTAAHCVDGDDEIAAFVGVSSLDDLTDHQALKVKKTIIHDDYDIFSSGVFDIALVKLAKKITLGPNVQIIALGTGNPVIGEEVTLIGFGATKCKPGTRICSTSEHLRKTDTVVKGYGEENAIESSGDNTNVCYGDSGGPMIYEGTVVGVAATVDYAGCMKGGNTYTSVSENLEWIKKKGNLK